MKWMRRHGTIVGIVDDLFDENPKTFIADLAMIEGAVDAACAASKCGATVTLHMLCGAYGVEELTEYE